MLKASKRAGAFFCCQYEYCSSYPTLLKLSNTLPRTYNNFIAQQNTLPMEENETPTTATTVNLENDDYEDIDMRVVSQAALQACNEDLVVQLHQQRARVESLEIMLSETTAKKTSLATSTVSSLAISTTVQDAPIQEPSYNLAKRPLTVSTNQETVQPKQKKGRTSTHIHFAPEDDQNLIDGVRKYSQGHPHSPRWENVALEMKNGANALQVARRWREKLDPKLALLKTGRFTKGEDELLLQLMTEHAKDGRGGGIHWKQIGIKMNRNAKKCEHRGGTLSYKQKEFTPEDDNYLMAYRNQGVNFKNIAKEMGRTYKECKTRYDYLLADNIQ